MTIEPNIFEFATSELSQDAVICWILSFYNDKRSPMRTFSRHDRGKASFTLLI